MKSNWSIPKRYLRLTLYEGQKDSKALSQLTEDMSVKFNTSDSVSGALNEANIVISGLQVKKMFYLATSTTQWIKNWRPNRIIIEAGYENRRGLIFDGSVIKGTPSIENADYSIALKAMAMFSDLTQPKSYTYEGQIPVTRIAKNLADDLGLKFVDGLKDDSITVSNYNVRNQNSVAALRQLAQMTGLDIYSSKGRLYIKKAGQNIPSGNVVTLTTKDIIGIPEPTETGVIVNVRLNSSFISGQSVKVDSFKYPQLKSYDFFISTLSHNGDTRGRDWYTRLNLTKTGLGFY